MRHRRRALSALTVRVRSTSRRQGARRLCDEPASGRRLFCLRRRLGALAERGPRTANVLATSATGSTANSSGSMTDNRSESPCRQRFGRSTGQPPWLALDRCVGGVPVGCWPEWRGCSKSPYDLAPVERHRHDRRRAVYHRQGHVRPDRQGRGPPRRAAGPGPTAERRQLHAEHVRRGRRRRRRRALGRRSFASTTKEERPIRAFRHSADCSCPNGRPWSPVRTIGSRSS